tara:strand:- start:2504 stop:2947 length:444 start_codon:yes stop_codon:yes gene_type:complete
MSKPERTPPLDLTNHEVRAAGYDMYHKHDVCEVDIYNTVAREQDGAWLQAWVWVPYNKVRAAKKSKTFETKERYGRERIPEAPAATRSTGTSQQQGSVTEGQSGSRQVARGRGPSIKGGGLKGVSTPAATTKETVVDGSHAPTRSGR